MSSYKHFTLDERKYLQKLLSEGLSIRKIAFVLERSPSTVSREIAGTKLNGSRIENRTTNTGIIIGAPRICISDAAENRHAWHCAPALRNGNTLCRDWKNTGHLRQSAAGGTRIIRRKNHFVYQRSIDISG